MKACPKCGEIHPDRLKFCTKCGVKLVSYKPKIEKHELAPTPEIKEKVIIKEIEKVRQPINTKLILGIVVIISLSVVASLYISSAPRFFYQPTPVSPTATPVITPQEMEKKQCPASCDDGDHCTKDYCSSATGYECGHDAITPCCRNGVCDTVTEATFKVISTDYYTSLPKAEQDAKNWGIIFSKTTSGPITVTIGAPKLIVPPTATSAPVWIEVQNIGGGNVYKSSARSSDEMGILEVTVEGITCPSTSVRLIDGKGTLDCKINFVAGAITNSKDYSITAETSYYYSEGPAVVEQIANIRTCGKVIDRKTSEVVSNVAVVAVRKMFDQERVSTLADEKGDYCLFLPSYLIEETWDLYYGLDNVYFFSTMVKGQSS